MPKTYAQEVDDLPRYRTNRENEGEFETVRISKAGSIARRADNEIQAYKRVISLLGGVLDQITRREVEEDNSDAVTLKALAGQAFVELSGLSCSEGWPKSVQLKALKKLWKDEEEDRRTEELSEG